MLLMMRLCTTVIELMNIWIMMCYVFKNHRGILIEYQYNVQGNLPEWREILPNLEGK